MRWTKQEKDLVREKWELNWTIGDIVAVVDRSFNSVRGFIERNKHRWDIDREQNINTIASRYGASIINDQKWFRDEIEDPPKMVPIPENALHIPWIDLQTDQCQWGLSNDFYVEASNHFDCCGLPVDGGKGVRKRFCQYHAEWALENTDQS